MELAQRTQRDSGVTEESQRISSAEKLKVLSPHERAETSCCNGRKRHEDGAAQSFDQKRASEMGGYMELPIAQLIRTSQAIVPPPILAFIVYIRNRASQVSKLETRFGK